MEDFAVAIGGAIIRGTESGHGVPVVLVHAGVADRRSWLSVMDRLAEAGMRCVAYDQRGYGNTQSTDESYVHRDDLVAVLDDRDIEQAVLVGASRGGQVALDLALAEPSRVAALMLIGSAPSDSPFPPPTDEIAELFQAIQEADDAGDLARVNELEARVWLDGPLAPPQRVGSPLRELFLDMNGNALAAEPSPIPLPFDPTWDLLARVRAPVSILVGELDMPGLVAAASATADQIPNARFRLLPDTAHLPMLEHPDVIADEIADLVARL